jgi:hypothetical protein
MRACRHAHTNALLSLQLRRCIAPLVVGMTFARPQHTSRRCHQKGHPQVIGDLVHVEASGLQVDAALVWPPFGHMGEALSPHHAVVIGGARPTQDQMPRLTIRLTYLGLVEAWRGHWPHLGRGHWPHLGLGVAPLQQSPTEESGEHVLLLTHVGVYGCVEMVKLICVGVCSQGSSLASDVNTYT